MLIETHLQIARSLGRNTSNEGFWHLFLYSIQLLVLDHLMLYIYCWLNLIFWCVIVFFVLCIMFLYHWLQVIFILPLYLLSSFHLFLCLVLVLRKGLSFTILYSRCISIFHLNTDIKCWKYWWRIHMRKLILSFWWLCFNMP